MSRSGLAEKRGKERGPVPVIEQVAVVELLRTAFMVRRRLEIEMSNHGITGQQYNVLRILRGADEPLPIMTLASRMIEPEPGITRMIRRLESKGLLRRRASDTDARKSLCTLTKKGQRVLDALDGPVADANLEAVEGLGPRQLECLIESLRRIRVNVSPAGGA